MPEFLENRFNLDLGEKQSGKKVGDVILRSWVKGSYLAAEESVNVFYHYTYEGSVYIDSVTDPAMKASILAQSNYFGQTPKQLFLNPHVKQRTDRKLPLHPLKYSSHLAASEIRKSSSPITQIVTLHDKILIAGTNNLLKPRTYKKYVVMKFSALVLALTVRFWLLGFDNGLVSVWRVSKFGPRAVRHLKLEKPLCGHTDKITCLQLPEFPAPASAIFLNDFDLRECYSSCASSTFSDWLDTKWYATGHQGGAVKVWQMVHGFNPDSTLSKSGFGGLGVLNLGTMEPEYSR
ncbi:hypothetical protein VNO78_22052 [Psophocarpus tetragonolobus]|uniref:BEACH domain-containing protein n=1 Tax=Psophocarpus tetragonolobus TaxID=3891 RepID=A0AAN9SDP5_PSOTE